MATGVVQVWHVMVLATALGVVNALDVPTRQAFVVELVGKRDLLNAIALNSSVFNGARIVGPAVAGVLIARTGLAAPFLLNAASYLAVIAGLLAMRLPPFAVEQNPEPALRRLASGLRYIRHDVAVSTVRKSSRSRSPEQLRPLVQSWPTWLGSALTWTLLKLGPVFSAFCD